MTSHEYELAQSKGVYGTAAVDGTVVRAARDEDAETPPHCTAFSRRYSSVGGRNCAFSFRAVNAAFCAFAVNSFFALLCIHGIFAVCSVNSAFSLGSVNSAFSILSANSVLSIGCANSIMKVCF